AFFEDFLMLKRLNLSLKQGPLERLAAHAICTRIGLRYLFPFVMAVLLYFPALSSFFGRNPTHPLSLPLFSKTFMSAPVSAMITAELIRLTPGIVFSKALCRGKSRRQIASIFSIYSADCLINRSYSAFAICRLKRWCSFMQ